MMAVALLAGRQAIIGQLHSPDTGGPRTIPVMGLLALPHLDGHHRRAVSNTCGPLIISEFHLCVCCWLSPQIDEDNQYNQFAL